MHAVNQDQVKGKSDRMLGRIRETWGRLTDDEVVLYSGKRDQFFGKLEEKYGLLREEAEDRLRELEEKNDYGDHEEAA
jgi:uncharacterized protein YjbJ (UPF0337 family)